ncbi:TIGR02466 family protein [Marinivivus vitaminiproducens]|uniref:TIGR02466 family protein n=1 Tax=Marinivivus vitaminiproducens TaxID=3035935 RepID=UPI0027A29C9D|nr:TIGR02466 family protein [Geminicoccaceae bacterium SCSIO 64248]
MTVKAEVQALFATPVITAMLPDAQALNAELSRVILAKEGEGSSSVQASNLGGWQSSWDMEAWGGPATKTVLDAGRTLATRATSDRSGRKVQIAWKTNAWANVNRKGHGNEFHTHPGSYWSGTYYVEDGGIGDDPSLGGAFEMQDPRGVAPAMYAPKLAFAVPGGQSVGASELLQPRGGLLVLFPSWLSHAVRPYTGERMRISIAFNLSV